MRHASDRQRSPHPFASLAVAVTDGTTTHDLSPAAGYRDLCDEGQRLEHEGRPAEARVRFEAALQRIEAGVGGPGPSTLLRWIARTWQAEAKFEEALIVLEAAYAAAERDGDERALGHAQNLHGIIFWRMGQLDEARRLYLAARERALRHHEPILAAMTAQNLGVIASVRGEIEQALMYYESALREYRQLEMHRDECIALNNLGLLQTRLGRWAEADASYTEALRLAQRYVHPDIQTQLEVNHAALTVARGDYLEAQKEVTQALANSRARGDDTATAEALKLAGIISRVRKMHDMAEMHFRDAAKIAEQRQDILLLAELHRESAILYRESGRNRELLRSLNSAHRLFTELKARKDLADIERKTRELESEFIDVARRWGESTESKDRYTQGHCERVAEVACALAKHAGFDDTIIFWFRIGTLLHDVGKLVIPEEILNKPGRLTPDEWQLIKEHAVAGVQLLSDIEFPWDVIPIVRSHHEYWDGSGYPDGLVGDEIALEARIVCLADVYDALTTERSYKKALPHAQAMELMRRDVGRQFDPDLFLLFEEVMLAREKDHIPAPKAEEVIAHDATVDELTGLHLRRAFVDAVSERLAAVGGSDARDWTLAVIDVDSFKSVNDTFGHLQGDDVLRVVAGILREGVRDFDLVGRYAGDEFVLLLRSDIGEAVQIAERLRETVARSIIPIRANEEGAVSVSLSIGLSAAPQHGATFEALFASADGALYSAKRRGRNIVAVAGAEANASKPRLDLERFVGRESEVAQLISHFEAAVRGEARTLAVVGEAGVGKTTLVRRIMSEVRLRTGLIVFGRSQEADVRPPYGPWMDIISAIHGLDVMPKRAWPELERLVPVLSLGPTQNAAGGPGSKYALLDELVEFLRLAAAQRPLVLVLDDMQWGDMASMDALEHAVSLLENDRILICLTIRQEDAQRFETRRKRMSRNERYFELPLNRLNQLEVSTWITGAMHQAHADGELPGVLYRFTEGNPLFVKQVMQALFDEGLLWHNGVVWEWRDIDEMVLPTAIDDLVGRRLSRLSPAATKLLSFAAVFGRTFDLDEVKLAAQASDDELLDAVDEGLSSGVVEPARQQGTSAFCFVHGLMVDVVKRSMNPRRLQLAQVRAAEALEKLRPHALTEIATLYDLGGESQRASDAALKAGAQAAAVYALDDAIRVFRIAVRGATTNAARAEAKRQLLHVMHLSGRYAESEELCAELMQEASALNVSDLRIMAERTRLEVRALRGEAPAATMSGFNALLAEARECQAAREEVVLLTAISDFHARQGDGLSARQLAREARDAAERLEDLELRSDTTIRLGTALLDTAPADALTLFRSAAEMYASSGNLFGQTRCLVNAGIALQRLGNAAESELAYREAVAMASGAHFIDLQGLAALNLGVLLTRSGRYEAAEEQYQRAMQCFKKVKNEPRRLATLYNLAHLAHEQGDAAKAHDLSQAAADLASELGVEHVRVAALARIGLAAIALGTDHEMEDVARRLRLYKEHHPGWFTGRESVEAFMARYALSSGDVDTASRIFREAAAALQADPYDFGWLVAECAALFRLSNEKDLRAHLVRAYRETEQLGYLPLARRLASTARSVDVSLVEEALA